MKKNAEFEIDQEEQYGDVLEIMDLNDLNDLEDEYESEVFDATLDHPEYGDEPLQEDKQVELDLDLGVEEEEDEEEDEDEETSGNKKTSFIQELMSWVIPILIAVLAALILKTYVIINATVPTGSMLNTIHQKDNLFGFRLAYEFSEPERGDIIIFYNPDNESERYIKRLIGLPGEKVVIQDSKIYINDSEEPLEEDYLPEEWVKANGPYEFQVPEGSYLFLGDNRNDSWDARYWTNTYVTKDKIIGKAIFIYYPFNHIKWLNKHE